ncbi:MAG: hypothetical protein HOP09_14590 [Hyphomicrobium sp.]|nr:hypothetical protein [Hyphomicrobium sp.]
MTTTDDTSSKTKTEGFWSMSFAQAIGLVIDKAEAMRRKGWPKEYLVTLDYTVKPGPRGLPRLEYTKGLLQWRGEILGYTEYKLNNDDAFANDWEPARPNAPSAADDAAPGTTFRVETYIGNIEVDQTVVGKVFNIELGGWPFKGVEFTQGPFTVHQLEQDDCPVPAGWWVCHEAFTLPDGTTGHRRVSIHPDPQVALRVGKANANKYQPPLVIPTRAQGYLF